MTGRFRTAGRRRRVSAKVPALIVRLDDEARAYLILVERSVAAYVWAVIADTIRSAAAVAP